MNLDEGQGVSRAADMRRAFDLAFAVAPAADERPQDDLLAVGIAGDPYAIRLEEIAGVWSDRKIARLPGAVPELLGVAGLRGATVPVYDLRALFGYPAGPTPRWLVTANAGPVAFAFERLDGYVRLVRDTVSREPVRDVQSRSPVVRGVVRMDTVLRPVVHLPSMLDQIAVLVRQWRGRKDDNR